MLTTVRLDPRTTALVERLARRTRRTKSQLIRDAITHLAAAEAETTAVGSAYEAMESGLGCWDSGGAELSERTGQRVKALLARRAAARPAGPEDSRSTTRHGRRR